MSIEGKGEQFSPEFVEKAQNTMSALSGLGKSDTFSGPNEQSSLLKEVVKSQSQEKPAAENGKTEVSATGSENNDGSGNAEIIETAKIGESEKTGEAQQKTEKTDKSKEKVEDSPIVENISLVEKEEEGVATSFEKLEDVEKFVKSAGLELKDLSAELPKLLKVKEELTTEREQRANIERVLENMPTEMYNALVEYSHGRDWRSAINKSEPINFDTPFEKHDSEKLVEKYFPGKLSKEELEEFKDEDGDETVKEKVNNFIAMSRDKYAIDQEKFKIEKQKIDDNATRVLATRQESFNKSRANVFDEFKTSSLKLDDKFVSELDKNLASDQSILSMFKNQDGTLKDSAHKMAAMALEGFGLVTKLYQKTKRDIVTEQRTDLLQKNTGSQAIKKTGDVAQAGVSESEKKVGGYVESIMPKKKEGQTFG